MLTKAIYAVILYLRKNNGGDTNGLDEMRGDTNQA